MKPLVMREIAEELADGRELPHETVAVVAADQVDEPVLIIHGDDDSNPGTLTFQSEVFFEAVRGSGGTARLNPAANTLPLRRMIG